MGVDLLVWRLLGPENLRKVESEAETVVG
jgi:hypothetical protein